MADFATDREQFWHQLSDMLAIWAIQAGANGTDDKDSAAGEENMKKIKGALEKAGIEEKVIDTVLHSVKVLDAMERLRSKDSRKRKN